MHAVRAALSLALALVSPGTLDGQPSHGSRTPPPQEGYVDAGGGVRLFYRLVGAGRDTVIVLHGGPGFSMRYLAPDLEPLAARHVLLFYDQRGAGRSTLVRDSAGLDARRFVDDLEAVRSRFAIERMTLLGHSWGVGLAALYAMAHPDHVGRLILVDGVPPRGAELTAAFQGLDARRDSLTRNRVRQLRAARAANPGDASVCRAYYAVAFLTYYADTAAARRSKGDLCAGSPEAIANKPQNVDRFTLASLGDWDWRASLGAVTAPTLVIHGAVDFIPVETAREWVAAMPNARLEVIERAGHFPYLDAPARFFRSVESFLDEVHRGAGGR